MGAVSTELLYILFKDKLGLADKITHYSGTFLVQINSFKFDNMDKPRLQSLFFLFHFNTIPNYLFIFQQKNKNNRYKIATIKADIFKIQSYLSQNKSIHIIYFLLQFSADIKQIESLS